MDQAKEWTLAQILFTSVCVKQPQWQADARNSAEKH